MEVACLMLYRTSYLALQTEIMMYGFFLRDLKVKTVVITAHSN